MNFRAFTKYFISRRTTYRSAFRVLFVYQDYLAGRSAMDSYGLWLSEFDDELSFQTSMWRFDALEGSAQFEEAIRDAVQADAIILATYQRELPMGIRRWIKAWVPQKRGQKAALVAFLQADDDCSARAYLQKVSVTAGLEFFATPLKRPEMRMPHPGDPVREAWGIND